MPTSPQGLFLAVISLAVSGCGGSLVAPEGPQSNAFANQVADKCGKLSIGDQPIDYLLDVNSNDVYFVDELGKLSAGEIGKSTFANDINGFYPTGANQKAIDCVIAQLNGN